MEWRIAELPPLPWLQAPQALNILRIVQEALSNVLRHSGAKSVRVSIEAAHSTTGEPAVLIRIEDDGVGFNVELTTHGRGLTHMRNRADKLGGTIDIGSHENGGTQVCLTLPISVSTT
jgi:signal transduction histidine kinase